jgi:hypothetical protein
MYSHEMKEPEVIIDTPEFREWMKGLSMGQRMRVQERMAIRSAICKAEDAIGMISSSQQQSQEVWEAAAQWQLALVKEEDCQRFLGFFGYQLTPELSWKERPSEHGPQLELRLDGHTQQAGHTWYHVKCKLSRVDTNAGTDCFEWVAPRRLVQLRVDLHHRVKDKLGFLQYDDQFSDCRFAKLGGPPGTTARLKSWLDKLAVVVNKGIARPDIVMLVLVFFSVPLPEGVAPPSLGAALRNQDMENCSQLGLDSELGSQQHALT